MTTHVPMPSDEAPVPNGAAAPSQSPHVQTTRAWVPITISLRSMWFAAGIVLAILVLLLLVTQALGALVLIFLAVILGEALRPIVSGLRRYHLPGPLAVLLIFMALIGMLGACLWVLLNPLVRQVSNLSAEVPHYVTHIQHWLSSLERDLSANPALNNVVHQVSLQVASLAQQVIPYLVSVPLALLAGVLRLFINVVIVFTMTLFWLGASARLKPFLVELFAPAKRETVSTVIGKLSRSLGGWVRGALIQMVVIGLLTGLGLFVLGVPYALLLGLIAGLTEVVPYLGPWISGTIAVVVTLITVDPLKAVEVIGFFLVIQTIEGNVVEPLVMSRAVHLDPFLVIVAVLIGGELLGLIGVILAVPVAAVLQIVALEVIAPAIRLATRPEPTVQDTDQANLATLPAQEATSRQDSVKRRRLSLRSLRRAL